MEQFIVEDRTLFKVPDEDEFRIKNPAKLSLFGLPTAEWVHLSVGTAGLPEEVMNAAFVFFGTPVEGLMGRHMPSTQYSCPRQM